MTGFAALRDASRLSRARRLAGWAVVGGIVFLPLAILLAQSFRDGDRFTLENYRQLASARVLGLFLKSAAISALATVLSVVLGAGAALLLEPRRHPLRATLRLCALSPLLVPPYLHVAAWKPFLPGAFYREELEWARILAVAGILGASYAPLVFFFASHGLRSVSGEIREAARLTSGEWRAALRILLPLAAPAIAAGASLVFTLSFLEQETPLLLLVPAYSTQIFLQGSGGAGAAFAAAVPAMAVLLPLVWAADRWARRRGFAVTSGEAAGESSGRAGRWALLAAALLAGALVILPLARLVLMAGSASRFREAWLLYGEAVLEGVPVGLATAAAATLLAALVMVRSGSPSRAEALLAWTPLVAPGSAVAAALIAVYNRPVLGAVYGSVWILVIAGAVRFFPIAYHALAAHLRAVPRETWEAASLARPGPLRRLVVIDLPLAAPGLALAATAVLILQSGELAASVLLAPPGHRPLPVVISSELHYNVDLEVPAALALIQVASVLSMAAVIALAARAVARGNPRRNTPLLSGESATG